MFEGRGEPAATAALFSCARFVRVTAILSVTLKTVVDLRLSTCSGRKNGGRRTAWDRLGCVDPLAHKKKFKQSCDEATRLQ